MYSGKTEIVNILSKYNKEGKIFSNIHFFFVDFTIFFLFFVGAQTRILLTIFIILLLSILFIMLFCLYLRYRNKQMRLHQRAAELERKSTTPTLPLYLEKYQFSKDQLKIGSRIGVGTFGFMFKGQALGIVSNESKTDIGVKMVKGMNNNGVRLYECDEEVRFNLT